MPGDGTKFEMPRITRVQNATWLNNAATPCGGGAQLIEDAKAENLRKEKDRASRGSYDARSNRSRTNFLRG